MAIECKHGQLARKCDRCEDEQTIALLKSRIAALRAGLERIGLVDKWVRCHACRQYLSNCTEEDRARLSDMGRCEGAAARQLIDDDDAKAKGTP